MDMFKLLWSRRIFVFIFGLSKICIIIYFICESRIRKENETNLQIQLLQASKKLQFLSDKKKALEDTIEKILQKRRERPPLTMSDHERPPLKQYELTRRQVLRDINGFWWYMKSSLGSRIRDKNSSFKSDIKKIIVEGQDRYDGLLLLLDELEEADGFEGWRKIEAKKLSDLVQGRLHALQHPTNCSSSPKLICNLNIDCGFGCQLHHVVYCLIVAYGSGRTLILKSSDWNYGKGAFERLFKPMSGRCSSISQKNAFLKSLNWWPGKPGNEKLKFSSMKNMISSLEFG